MPYELILAYQCFIDSTENCLTEYYNYEKLRTEKHFKGTKEQQNATSSVWVKLDGRNNIC